MVARTTILIALGTLAVACGGVVSDDQADAGSVDAAQADAPSTGVDCSGSSISAANLKVCYTRAFCRIHTECQVFFAPGDDCENLLYDYYRSLGIDIEYLIDQFAAQLAAGTVGYDGEALAECLNPPNDACDTSPPACNRVLVGLLDDNDQCVSSNECGRGGSCEGTDGTRCSVGACTLPAALGQPCGGAGNVRCETGLVCSQNVNGEQRCTSGDVGQGCTNDGECDQGLFCDDAGTGLCTAPRAEGQVCNDDQECIQPLDCIAGSCQRPDADGDPCDFNCIGPFFCQQGGVGGGNNNVCRPLPTLDGDCSQSGRCIGANVYCDGQTCLNRAPLDSPCDNDSIKCELGTYCNTTTSVCTTPEADGSACTANDSCDSFICEGTPQECGERDLCY